MTSPRSTRRPGRDLSSLVEAAVEEVYRLRERGLWFCPTAVVPKGSPMTVLQVWGVLHFLPNGRFCCGEPGCYMVLGEDVADHVRKALGLRHPLRIEGWNRIDVHYHAGVKFRSS